MKYNKATLSLKAFFTRQCWSRIKILQIIKNFILQAFITFSNNIFVCYLTIFRGQHVRELLTTVQAPIASQQTTETTSKVATDELKTFTYNVNNI